MAIDELSNEELLTMLKELTNEEKHFIWLQIRNIIKAREIGVNNDTPT